MDFKSLILPSKQNQVTRSFPQADTEKIIRPSEILIEWEAAERIFKERSREFYRRMSIIILFFVLMLFILKEFLLIGVLGLVFFAVYVFHTVPPRVFKHLITTNGINYASGHLFRWEELTSFFIERKEDVDMLIVNTKEPLPGRIMMLLSDKVDKAKLSEILNRYISIVENPEPGLFEKWSNAFSKRLRM